MTNINTLNPTTHDLSKSPSKGRLKKLGKIVAISAGLAGSLIALKEAGDHVDPFATSIAVPTETQPHQTYSVNSGDTEGSIAAKFGHAEDPNYENMINKQLPKADQHMRTLRPGEKLTLPIDK